MANDRVSLSDASRRLRVLLVEAPLHAYLVSYSLHHVSTSLTMIADSSCDRIGLFESSHTMHKPLACHFRTTIKGTRSTPPPRDCTCGVSTQSASLTLTYTPDGYGGAAAATDTAHGSRDGGVGRHPPSHPCRHRAAARSRRGGRGWRSNFLGNHWADRARTWTVARTAAARLLLDGWRWTTVQESVASSTSMRRPEPVK